MKSLALSLVAQRAKGNMFKDPFHLPGCSRSARGSSQAKRDTRMILRFNRIGGGPKALETRALSLTRSR